MRPPRTAVSPIRTLAGKHGIEPDAFRAWLDYLGIGSGDAVQLRGHLPKPVKNASLRVHQRLGLPRTAELLANSSDQQSAFRAT